MMAYGVLVIMSVLLIYSMSKIDSLEERIERLERNDKTLYKLIMNIEKEMEDGKDE